MSEKRTNGVTAVVCPMSVFENVPSGEVAEIDEIARLTTELQDKRKDLPKQEGRLLRGVHAKAHRLRT